LWLDQSATIGEFGGCRTFPSAASDRREESSILVVDIDEDNLKQGVLALVVSLVEIIQETLELQAFRRMESGSLTPDEVERLGRALSDLGVAIEQIKCEQGLSDAVQQVRDGLDDLVDDVIDRFLNPERWLQEAGTKGREGAQPSGTDIPARSGSR
jgi:hypothetical protein